MTVRWRNGRNPAMKGPEEWAAVRRDLLANSLAMMTAGDAIVGSSEASRRKRAELQDRIAALDRQIGASAQDGGNL